MDIVSDSKRWKQIREFPDYWVSSDGLVFNLTQQKRVFTRRREDGCVYVTLQKSQTKNARRFPIRIKHLMENYWPGGV